MTGSKSSPSLRSSNQALFNPRKSRSREGENARKVGSSPNRRGTRCYVTSQLTTRTFVLPKSTWRDESYYPAENEIHDNQVRYVLHHVATDSVHKTPVLLGHYNVVLDEICEELQHFPSTHVLVTAILHAIIAHSDAMNKAQILHRDVSASNIVIVKSKTGIPEGRLIDWECSVDISSDLSRSTSQRTGTFHFMAVAIHDDPSTRQTIAHDLESFIWLLTHTATFYAPKESEPRAYYPPFLSLSQTKMLMCDDSTSFPRNLHLQSEPLTLLLSKLLVAIGDLYRSPDEWDRLRLDMTKYITGRLPEIGFPVTSKLGSQLKRYLKKKYLERRTRLLNHEWIIDTLKSVLDDEEWKAKEDHWVKRK